MTDGRDRKSSVQSVLSLVRRAKKNLPDDLQATGKLEAHFHLRSGETVRHGLMAVDRPPASACYQRQQSQNWF